MSPSPYLVLSSGWDPTVNKTQTPSTDISAFNFATPYPDDTVVIMLASTTGVSSWTLSLVSVSDNATIAAFTLTQASLVSGQAYLSLPSLADDFACLLVSTINGGQTNGATDSTLISTAKISHQITHKTPMTAYETFEASIGSGWAKIVNRSGMTDGTRIDNAYIRVNQLCLQTFATQVNSSTPGYAAGFTLVDSLATAFNFGGITSAKLGSDLSTNPKTVRTARAGLSAAASALQLHQATVSDNAMILKTVIGSPAIYSSFSMWCDFEWSGQLPAQMMLLLYKCFQNEATPSSTLYGVGVYIDPASPNGRLLLNYNNAAYELHATITPGAHKIGVTINASINVITVWVDGAKIPVQVAGISTNNQGQIYLGALAASGSATASYQIVYKDFRAWSAIVSDDIFVALSKQEL